MSGMWGADVNQLRTLAQSMQSASDQLVTTTSQVSGLVEASTRWQGGDADQFRGEWTGTSVALLRGVSQTLAEAAQKVLRNADEQFATSTEGGSIPSPGVPGPSGPGGPGVPTGPGGGPLGPVAPGGGWPDVDLLDGWNAYSTAVGLRGLPGAWNLASSFVTATRLADLGSDAAASASFFTRGMAVADTLILGTSTLSRFGLGALGVVGAIDSFQTMLNSDYDGARGVVDQVMGGVGVVGGIGTTLVAIGLVSNPVGIAVIGTAAVAAGLWSLGNLVVDNWDSISGFVSDGWDTVTNVGGAVVDTIGDVAGDVGDAIGDGLSAAGDFIGGLFG